MIYRMVGCLAAAALLAVTALSAAPGNTASQARRPVALAGDEQNLFAANRDSGTITTIDPQRLQVVSESPAGKRLADLIALSDGRLLAVDEAAGELLVLARNGDALEVRHRLAVGLAPVSVRINKTGTRAFIACLWGHQLTVVTLPTGAAPALEKTIQLPFTARLQLPLPEDRLLVADAFGGRLALLDTHRGAVLSVRTLPAHNIRGLALDPGGREVMLAQQILREETPARSDEVRWGNVITNAIRTLRLEDVLRPDADLIPGSQVSTLGEFRHGAADPSGLALTGSRIIVSLGGTSEVALGPVASGDWPRLTVGRRPTAVILSADGRRAYVANTLADSISVLDLTARKVIGTVSLGPAPSPDSVRRGEELFFDGRLSREGWMSCHSCHTDGHTNGLRSDTLGDGSYGNPKRVLSLLGVGQTEPWAWNGSMPALQTQIRQSITTTMNGPQPTQQQLTDLEAFLRSLKPPPPAPLAAGSTDAVRHGHQVFRAHGCVRCHTPPTYTSPRTYDVGLADENGLRAFNPPSLRGVGHARAFFHDNRAGSLEEVFVRYHHQVRSELARKDLDDLVTFLRTL